VKRSSRTSQNREAISRSRSVRPTSCNNVPGLIRSPELTAALALAALYAAVMSGHLHSIDGYLMWQQARAIAFHHTLQFDPPISWEPHVFRTSNFAIGLSLLYVPGLLLWSWLQPTVRLEAPLSGGMGLYGDPLYPALGAPLHVLVTAAAAYVVARLIRQLGFGTGTALFGLALYGLASPALVYSHGDWAQPLEGLCWLLAISAAVVVRQRQSWKAAAGCAIALLFAVLTRPLEGSLLLLAVLLVVIPGVRFRRWPRAVVRSLGLVLMGFVCGTALTMLVNFLRYGDPLDTGYGSIVGQMTTPLLEGLAGAIISPARGIVWAMPGVLIAPAGVYRLWRGEHRTVGVVLAGLSVLLLLMTAKWIAWWGGSNWGLRLFIPALPLLAVLAAVGGTALRPSVSRWFQPAVLIAGMVWAIPGIVTDALAGYAGLADGTEGSFRWDAYPPFGAWQYLKYPFATTTVDAASVDIIWFRLANATGNVSLIPMLGLLTVALACAGRVWLLWRVRGPYSLLPTPSHIFHRGVRATDIVAKADASCPHAKPDQPWWCGYRSRTVFTLLGLLVLGASLRFYHLGHFSFWLDETIQYAFAVTPLSSILFQLQADQMFLTTLLSHLQIRAGFGETIEQLRLPSAVFGIATVVVIWLLGRALFGEMVGLLGGLLAATWPVLVVYSQEYRPYSLQVLLFSMLLFLLVQAYRTNGPIWWALLSMSAILYLYNHLTSVISIAGLAIVAAAWLAIDVVVGGHKSTSGRVHFVRTTSSIIVVSGIILTGYLPGVMILANFLEKSQTTSYIAGVKNPLVLSQASLETIFGRYLGLGNGGFLLLTGGLAVAGLAWAIRRHFHGALLAAISLGFPLFVFSQTGGGGSVLNSERYLLFIAPMYILLIAAGTVGVARLVAWLVGYSVYLVGHTTGRKAWIGSEWGVVVARWERMVVWIVAGLLLCVVCLRLVDTYGRNPKQTPADLASAYAHVLSRLRPGDVLLETSVTPGIPTQWFDYYDHYFLRSQVRPADVLVFRFGKDWGRPEPVCLTLKIPEVERACIAEGEGDREGRAEGLPRGGRVAKVPGRVWVLVTARAADQGALRGRVTAGSDVSCFENICVLEPVEGAGPDAESQLRFYLRALADVAI
jgi:hypothetical protein